MFVMKNKASRSALSFGFVDKMHRPAVTTQTDFFECCTLYITFSDQKWIKIYSLLSAGSVPDGGILSERGSNTF
jgi:hypothetical protein